MKSIIWAGAFAVVLCAGVLHAAEMSDEERDVWAIVEQSWADEVAENGKWPADYVTDDVVSWGKSWPMPRRKDSVAKWARFTSDSSETLIHELFPVSVVVHGDTAIALYNAVVVSENAKGERERRSEGLMETLVRDGGSWKFLALTSFDLGSE